MIDVANFANGVNGISTMTFAQARKLWGNLINMIETMMATSSLNGSLNWFTGTGQDTTAIQTLQTQLNSMGYYINDSSSHGDGDDYDRWPALRDLWTRMVIESNALSEATGASLDNIGQIPDYVGQSIQALPTTVGNAVGEVTGAIGSAAGGLAGGFLSGLGLPLLIVGGIVVYLIIREGV